MQHVVFETEYKPVKKEDPKVRHQLSGLLKTPKYRRSPDVKYEGQPVLDIITHVPDPYSLCSMVHTIEMVHCLLHNLSQSTDSQKEILLTGYIRRVLTVE